MRGSRAFRALTATGLLVATLLLGFFLWSFFRAGGSSSSPPVADRASEPSYIVAADTHGAIVQDAQGQSFRGVAAQGGLVWTSAQALLDGDTLVCAARCPQAVASGGLDALNGVGTPTVEPILLGGAKGQFAEAFKTTVVAADGGDSVLVQGDASGEAWILNDGEKVETATAQVAVVPSSGSSRLILGNVPSGDVVLRALTPTESGWRIGPQHTAKTFFGCVGDGGRLAYEGQTGIEIVGGRSGPTTVSSIVDAGECSFTASGWVVARFAVSSGGKKTTELWATDGTGDVLWHDRMDGEVRVSANPRDDEFVASDGTVARTYSLTGGLQKTIKGVRHAVYIGTGQLVALDISGDVQWL